MKSNFVNNDEAWKLHEDGDCVGTDCEFCKMLDELEEEYEYVEQKKAKVASFRKNEKDLKKQ